MNMNRKKYEAEPYLRATTPEHVTMNHYLREQGRMDIVMAWDKQGFIGNLREYVYEKHPDIWVTYKVWRRIINGL